MEILYWFGETDADSAEEHPPRDTWIRLQHKGELSIPSIKIRNMRNQHNLRKIILD
jgi:hypothetical protein